MNEGVLGVDASRGLALERSDGEASRTAFCAAVGSRRAVSQIGAFDTTASRA